MGVVKTMLIIGAILSDTCKQSTNTYSNTKLNKKVVVYDAYIFKILRTTISSLF